MAPLPTITNLFRVEFIWNGTPITPVNVLHFESVASADVRAIALKLGSTYPGAGGKPFQILHGNYSCSSVLITPLDGHTAGTVQPLGVTINGATSGDMILNDACCVSFQTAQRGPRGRGRTFIGPIAESSQGNGVISSAEATAVLNGWTTWHSAMRATPTPLSPSIASYVHSDYNPIVGVRVNSKVSSQIRRLHALP